MQYEAAEVGRCLRAGLLESPDLPLAETVAIMATMDEIRAQIGLTYPGRVAQSTLRTSSASQHGDDLRHLVGAEDTGAAELGQDREKPLGRTELVLEEVEGVGQRVADRQAEHAQPDRVQQDPRLVTDPGLGVDQVAVVEAHARVDDDPLHAPAAGRVDPAGRSGRGAPGTGRPRARRR